MQKDKMPLRVADFGWREVFCRVAPKRSKVAGWINFETLNFDRPRERVFVTRVDR